MEAGGKSQGSRATKRFCRLDHKSITHKRILNFCSESPCGEYKKTNCRDWKKITNPTQDWYPAYTTDPLIISFCLTSFTSVSYYYNID